MSIAFKSLSRAASAIYYTQFSRRGAEAERNPKTAKTPVLNPKFHHEEHEDHEEKA
jgi:hypothetical protein